MGRILASATRVVAIVAFLLASSQLTGKCLAQTRESYGVGITISGPAAGRELIRAQLDSLAKLPTGKRLLAAIDEAAKDGKAVTIEFGPGAASVIPAPGSNVRDVYPRRYEMEGDAVRIVEPGPGASALIRLDPEYKRVHEDTGTACVSPEAILAHELVHALHMLQGRLLSRLSHVEPNGTVTNFEERVTTGLGGVIDDDGLNENAIRREQNLENRSTYARLCQLSPVVPKKSFLDALERNRAAANGTSSEPTSSPEPGAGSQETAPPRHSSAERARLLAELLNSPLGD